jgi:hypothetical protein
MPAIVNKNNFKLSFTNEHTVYENYITAQIATGSDFQPYATTLGLYNDDNELLMVAKFGQPVPISLETDMTFLIRYDS